DIKEGDDMEITLSTDHDLQSYHTSTPAVKENPKSVEQSESIVSIYYFSMN
ncbi:unnamed protein product, partial [Rotaria magnacalcarata]